MSGNRTDASVLRNQRKTDAGLATEAEKESVGNPPQDREIRVGESYGRTVVPATLEKDRTYGMDSGVEEIGKRDPYAARHLLVRGYFWLGLQAEDMAGDSHRKVVSTQLGKGTEVVSQSKINTDLFSGFAMGSGKTCCIVRINSAAGEADIPRPGVEGMGRPPDEKDFGG